MEKINNRGKIGIGLIIGLILIVGMMKMAFSSELPGQNQNKDILPPAIGNENPIINPLPKNKSFQDEIQFPYIIMDTIKEDIIDSKTGEIIDTKTIIGIDTNGDGKYDYVEEKNGKNGNDKNNKKNRGGEK